MICDAIRTQLRLTKEQSTFVEIPKEEYDKAQQALQDLGTEFLNVDDFINQQIRALLEKYQEWSKQKRRV